MGSLGEGKITSDHVKSQRRMALFSSAVEQKLALRLAFVFVFPLLTLAYVATNQFADSKLEFTQKHLANEAKDYGMTLAERLNARVFAALGKSPSEYLDSRFPLAATSTSIFVTVNSAAPEAPLEIRLSDITRDLEEVENIQRCVSFAAGGCHMPEGSLSSQWQLRLLTLYDTNESIYVTTWLAADDQLLKENLLIEIFPLLVALLVILMTYSGAIFLRQRLLPLNELKHGVIALERGQFGHQVDTVSDDEFGELGDAFNSMSNQIESSFGFQIIVAEIDEAILSGSEMKSVFAKCREALLKYCGVGAAVLIESGDAFWNVYQEQDGGITKDQVKTKPELADFFVGGHAFPILNEQAVSGWLFIDELVTRHDIRVLEIIRKLSVCDTTIRRSEALYQQANYDDLTGLLNRTSFSFQLARKVAHVKRTGKTGVLIYLDLDGFKKVNDSEGHSAGDQLLKVIAKRIEKSVREEDIVARLGGDEFAIALDEFTDDSHLVSFLQRVLGDLAIPVRAGKLEISIQASMGVCVFPRDGNSVEGLLKNADIAMYRAKQSAGNSFMFYNEGLNKEAERQLLVEARLGRAIRNKDLEVFLQPKLDTTSGLITSCEALSRWNDEELGFVSPDEFIRVAERSGLIQALTENLFSDVAQLLSKSVVGLESIAINVSPTQLNQSGFVGEITRYITQSGIDTSSVEIEVTESNFMEDPERVAHILSELRDRGLRISLDDFGTGYSSLNLLRQLPLDYLKIDKAFVDEIIEDTQARGLVQKIIEIAEGLGIGVVAEGVETEDQLELLTDMQCGFIQGYFISKPLPGTEAIAFIESWNASARTRTGKIGALA